MRIGLRDFEVINLTPCVVLCGGKSSRMGRDKAMLPFLGFDTLLEYQMAKLGDIFSDIYLSYKKSDSENSSADGCNQNIGKCLTFPHKKILENGNLFTPLNGILSSFKALKSQNIFFISVDTPFVRLDSIYRIYKNMEEKALSKGADISFAKTDKNHYLVGIWSRSSCGVIEDCLNGGDFKIGEVVKRLKSAPVEFEDESEFFNLNSKEEYALALELAQKMDED